MAKENQITAILYGLAAILNINETVLFWFCVVMAFDMILGAMKSIIVAEMRFSTKTFFFGMLRKITLLVLILFFASLGIGLGFTNLKDIITILIKVLMISEGISALYCFKSIVSGVETKPEDYISKIIETLIKFLGKKLEGLLNFFDSNSSCL